MADSGDNGDDGYEVGFGKPPVPTRWPKGHSGNNKGRPKGAKNIATIVREAMAEKVVINANGRKKEITKRELMIAQQINKAATGDWRAFQAMIKLDKDNHQPEPFEPEPQDKEIIDNFFSRLKGKVSDEDINK